MMHNHSLASLDLLQSPAVLRKSKKFQENLPKGGKTDNISVEKQVGLRGRAARVRVDSGALRGGRAQRQLVIAPNFKALAGKWRVNVILSQCERRGPSQRERAEDVLDSEGDSSLSHMSTLMSSNNSGRLKVFQRRWSVPLR